MKHTIQRPSRLPAKKQSPTSFFQFATVILNVSQLLPSPFPRDIFLLPCYLHRSNIIISGRRSLAVIARHCYSTCDHQISNTSSGCRLGLLTRRSAFAAAQTCAHRTVTVVPRNRLSLAKDQSTILNSSFHWLLSCTRVAPPSSPPASTPVPR
jgi:hypothetical protein